MKSQSLRPTTMRRIAALALTVLMVPLASCTPLSRPQTTPDHALMIEGVSVLPMTKGGEPLHDATILIENGRIKKITRADRGGRPANVRVIDGRGKWLIPGLSDMHVHLPNRGFGRLVPGGKTLTHAEMSNADVMLPFIANGVTQILEMGSMPETLEQRAEVENGSVLGPHITAAAMVDGAPPAWEGQASVAIKAEDGRNIVKRLKVEGYDAIKVYGGLDLPTYRAILGEAHALGMKVTGHLPVAAKDRTDELFIEGLSGVAHAEEFFKQSQDRSDAQIARYADLMKKRGVWLTSTAITNVVITQQVADPSVIAALPELKYVHPLIVSVWLHANRYTTEDNRKRVSAFQAVSDFNARLIPAFAKAGVPIMPGTDATVSGLVYGFALHDELALLVDLGLSNRTVLESATRLPAEWLGVAQDRGTIEVGKRADLVLLDANPLQDIKNTKAISAVIRNGRYLPRAELDRSMAELAARYRAASNRGN